MCYSLIDLESELSDDLPLYNLELNLEEIQGRIEGLEEERTDLINRVNTVTLHLTHLKKYTEIYLKSIDAVKKIQNDILTGTEFSKP